MHADGIANSIGPDLSLNILNFYSIIIFLIFTIHVHIWHAYPFLTS